MVRKAEGIGTPSTESVNCSESVKPKSRASATTPSGRQRSKLHRR
jgi:hypothetical protein